jgi:hypothetical protein
VGVIVGGVVTTVGEGGKTGVTVGGTVGNSFVEIDMPGAGTVERVLVGGGD